MTSGPSPYAEKYPAQAKYKARKIAERAAARGYKYAQDKPACPQGHPRTPENRRPGRGDCAVCHREQQLVRNRTAGALERQPGMSDDEYRLARRRWESKRRALKAGGFVESVDPLEVYRRSAGICGICSRNVPIDAFEVDHRKALARGGEHSYANTQAAHPTCNRRKHAR